MLMFFITQFHSFGGEEFSDEKWFNTKLIKAKTNSKGKDTRFLNKNK